MMPSGGGMRLRPMTIGDIIDETIKIYRRHFLAFVTAMAVAAVTQAVLSVLIGLATVGLEEGRVPSMDQLAAIGAISLPVLVLTVVAYLVSTGAVVWLASEAILGRSADVSAALRVGLGRSWSVIWASFLLGLACGLLTITIIGIPFAIFLGVGWSLYDQTVVIERRGGGSALTRSSTLVSGHRWRVLGTVILLSILTSILISIPTALVGAATGMVSIASSATGSGAVSAVIQVINALASAAAQALFGPIGLITMTVMYYELRVRKEAFDLEQRSEPSGETSPPQYLR
jgi:hypothetical protein